MRPAVCAVLGLAGLLGGAVASELRLSRPVQPLTDTWQTMPIEPRGRTRLGFNFRTPQIEAFGLDGPTMLTALLAYPFQIVRLGAYWRRIEPASGRFDPSELDRQVDMAERAQKQIILAVGAVKSFGYPEFFAPPHVAASLPEHQRIRASAYPALLGAATEFVERIVDRYRASTHVVAWQVEHEAVDPLGLEQS
ncbi:MAG: beta-galactosidase, partial [Chloroflexi bacterium]|nr:beta-galactosidase [Chloroflexota bacterium]